MVGKHIEIAIHVQHPFKMPETSGMEYFGM
jgi:hypothetical protein